VTVQKLKPTIDSEFEAAKRYYKVISAINKLDLTEMEVNLFAFMAVKGSISNTNNKATFCETFDSTENSVNNVINRLTKRGLLLKKEGKVKIINPIALNFKEPVIVKITFDAEAPK